MNSLEKDIIDYTFSGEKQKFISGRCAKSILEKRNWYNYLINKYDDNSTDSLIEVLYRIKYGIDEIPKCKICGKPLKFTNGSYPNYCSAKCRNNDPNVIAKNKEGVSKSLKAGSYKFFPIKSNLEPWQGQSQVLSASFQESKHPK